MEHLLQAFTAKRTSSEAYELLPDFLRGPPTEVARFVDAVLTSLPDGGNFLNAALSFVSDDALDALVQKWIAPLDSDGMTAAVESLLVYVALQRPASLHPFLTKLFELCPNQGSYYENWPWRDAPSSALDYLVAQASGGDEDARSKAFLCLMETRLPAAFAICTRLEQAIPVRHPLHIYFQLVGHAGNGKALYQEETFHLIFPDEHFGVPDNSWSLQAMHPTWHLGNGGDTFKFGGEGSCHCGLCGNKLHRLMEIPENRLGLSAKTQLVSLQVCLSCLGWEEPVLYYRHDESGNVVSLNEGKCAPQFPAPLLTPCTVELAATPARWHWQDWALSNSRENLHRIGGFPCWIQDADHPSCPACSEKMTFMMQLDSDLPSDDGDSWSWGSGGIGYGFRCAPCRTVAYLWQCT
jgi:hypothetical protein